MTLYLEKPAGKFTPWNPKTRINGLLLPRNCEALWSDDELSTYGLYRPAAANPLNPGRIAVSSSVKRVSGVVKWVNVTAAEPAPSTDPRDYELTPGQFEYLLVDTELDDALEAAKSSTKQARGASLAAKEAEARFKMALKGQSFNFDATLGLIAALAAHIPPGVTIDEPFLSPYWLKAAAQ